MPRARPELQLGVTRRAQLQQSVVAAIVKLEAGYGLRVTAIETFGETQHGCQMADAPPPFFPEVAVTDVIAFGRRLPMVACDQRDVFDFLGIESSQIPVLD